MLYMVLTCWNGASKDNVNVIIICPGFIQTNVAVKRADRRWIKTKHNDQATLNGMPVAILQKN
jgi:short-subunit dehydrogenase